MSANNNPRNRRNDGYQSKVTFWTEQLQLAMDGKSKYSYERCVDSLTYFKERRAAYLEGNAMLQERKEVVKPILNARAHYSLQQWAEEMGFDKH